jgi:hypothetical protein
VVGRLSYGLMVLTFMAGGLGCSSPWLPFDFYMEAAMEGRRLSTRSNAEILAGMYGTLYLYSFAWSVKLLAGHVWLRVSYLKSALLGCRCYESHAICACCELGGRVSGSLDSWIAVSEKGMMLSYVPSHIFLNFMYFFSLGMATFV